MIDRYCQTLNVEKAKMTTETNVETVEKDKKRVADAISGGIFLISLGVLLYTGWWWPGIMIALGLSSGASLIFCGKI
jgi:predicted phage tail protein